MTNLINRINDAQIKNDIPNFSSGDTLSITSKIIEENKKDRLQTFQGVVIKKQGSGPSQSVLLRKVTANVSIEKMFPLHSPLIEEIKLIKKGKVRRARIYYIKERFGKSARIKELKK